MMTSVTSVDISPRADVQLGGYVGRDGLSTGSDTPLEGNIVAIVGSNNRPVVLVSVDLLYPGRALRGYLEAALPNLSPDQLFLAASHTHQAPMTDDTKPMLGKTN